MYTSEQGNTVDYIQEASQSYFHVFIIELGSL